MAVVDTAAGRVTYSHYYVGSRIKVFQWPVRLSVSPSVPCLRFSQNITRKPSYRWQTRATRKHAKIAPIRRSTCLQRCRWQCWSIFIRLAVGPSEICEIPRNSPKIQTYRVQDHPRSSILVPIESPYVTCY